MTTFFTPDTHFGHESIISHCARRFANAAKMNEAMIANWNAVVGRADRVIHSGDFAHRIEERDCGRSSVRLMARSFL